MSSTAIAQVECPICKAAFSFEYHLLGSQHRCPGCTRWIVPLVPQGGFFPQSGIELQYGDFLQLLPEVEFQALVERWFGYSVARDGDSAVIHNAANERIELLWIHRRIQSDQAKAGEMYNLAMTLWR
jgi:hypothetical protein